MHPTQNTVADVSVTPSVTLRASAGYLLHFGWNQGDMFDPYVLSDREDPSRATPPACALGGIHMAVLGTPELVDWSPEQVQRFDAAVATLADHLILAYQVAGPDVAEVLAEDSPSGLEQVVSGWNDDGERNASQVIAAMYGAADEWERLHPPHVDYPHEPGYLYDCPACESECFCSAGSSECVHCAISGGDA